MPAVPLACTEQALAREPARRGQSASAAVIAAERVAVVGQAIGALPEQQRVTLTMAAASGLASGEIADVLGVPAGTVRYRLSLALTSRDQADRQSLEAVDEGAWPPTQLLGGHR